MALARRVVLALGVLGPALFLAADLRGVADPVRDRVALQGGMVVVAGVMLAGFGLAVSALFAGRAPMVLAGRLIAFWAGLGALVAALGLVHTVLVTIATLALIGAVVLVRRSTEVAWFGVFSSGCLVVMFAGAGLIGIAGVFGWPVLGLADRMMQWTWLAWLAVLAVRCIAEDMGRD